MKTYHIYFLIIMITPSLYPQTMYIFSHGLTCNEKQAKKYRTIITPTPSLTWLINDPYISFNYPDAEKPSIFSSQTSLAQNNEIETLNAAYKRARNQSDSIVLVGMSRGAATIVSFVGSKQPSKVKAIVVESPFDSIKNVLNHKLQSQKVRWIPEYIINTAPGIIFSKYKHTDMGPIDLAPQIPKNLPILLIASLEDGIVPAKNTCDLYLTLLESGHTYVHFLLLNKGVHGGLLNGPESERYISVTHAFYKKYALPYEESYAQKGESFFLQCQPSPTTIKKAFEQQKSFISLNNPSI